MPAKWKIFAAGFLTCILLTFFITSVLAAGDVSIQAMLSNTIRLKLNGQDWAPRDSATGEYLKPIVYKGRTYLPLRAVAEEAANMAVEYDAATKTIWLGGKTEILEIKDTRYYHNDYGTIITTDINKLTTPQAKYKWGVTNEKPMSMQYFNFYLKPDGKYKYFRASFYLEKEAVKSLTMTVRNNSFTGEVLRTLTLQPGETLKDVVIDTSGLSKVFFQTNISQGYGTINQLVVGEPVFYN
jgi:hypothetical protein